MYEHDFTAHLDAIAKALNSNGFATRPFGVGVIHHATSDRARVDIHCAQSAGLPEATLPEMHVRPADDGECEGEYWATYTWATPPEVIAAAAVAALAAPLLGDLTPNTDR